MRLYRLGTIGAPRGLRGEVRLALHTDAPEQRLAPGTQVATEPDIGPLTITQVFDRPNGWFVQFQGRPDRTSVEGLAGTILLAEGTQEESAWYQDELAGLSAQRPNGEEIGLVVGLEHYPGQDMLVIEERAGERTLVPLVEQIVPTVDVEAGIVVVDAPTGLLAADGGEQ